MGGIERVPLEELAVLPDQPVELCDVEPAQPVEKHEVLRRGDRRDGIQLEEPEPAYGVEDVLPAAVEQLGPDRDTAGPLDVRVRLIGRTLAGP